MSLLKEGSSPHKHPKRRAPAGAVETETGTSGADGTKTDESRDEDHPEPARGGATHRAVAPPSSPPASAPRRTGRGLERPKTAERRGLVDSAIVALLFHGALRRSEVAALCWADVDFSDGDDVVVTVRRAKTDPTGGRADVRRLVGSYAAAVRSLHAATTPEPGDSVVSLSVDQINRRFAAAGTAAGLEGAQDLARRPRRSRRRAHRPRGFHACHPNRRAAGRAPAMVVRYAASVSTREGAVSRYLRSSGR